MERLGNVLFTVTVTCLVSAGIPSRTGGSVPTAMPLFQQSWQSADTEPVGCGRSLSVWMDRCWFGTRGGTQGKSGLTQRASPSVNSPGPRGVSWNFRWTLSCCWWWHRPGKWLIIVQLHFGGHFFLKEEQICLASHPHISSCIVLSSKHFIAGLMCQVHVLGTRKDIRRRLLPLEGFHSQGWREEEEKASSTMRCVITVTTGGLGAPGASPGRHASWRSITEFGAEK